MVLLQKILNQFSNQAIDRKVTNIDRREWAWSHGLIQNKHETSQSPWKRLLALLYSILSSLIVIHVQYEGVS